MSKTAAEIIKAAEPIVDEINRVFDANLKNAKAAEAIAKNALASIKGTKNVDRAFELASNAAAAAAALSDMNRKAYKDECIARDYYFKASRSESAYKAAATRAGFAVEAVAKYDAATDARYSIQCAYIHANDVKNEINHLMNAAHDAVMKAARIAQVLAAVTKAREIVENYPATAEADIAESVRRDLDARTKDIKQAMKDAGNYRNIYDNAALAAKAAEEVTKSAEQATQAATAAWHDASEARRMAEDAAVEERHEQAAAHAADARAAAERAEKIAKSANDSARTADECMTAEALAEIAAYARRDADNATETAEQAAAEAGAPEDIAHYCHEQARRYNWTEEETAEEIAYYIDLRSANAAARQLLDAYAETIGEYPDDEDAETRAAYKVARADIVARGREASDEQREIVARMVERIAAHIYGIVILDADGAETETTDYPTEAERDEAERSLNASGYAYMGNIGEYDYYRAPETNDDADDDAPAPYQRAELLALLGDFADQYDVDAIKAEATEYDARTGRTVWTATGDDLTRIIEAHEIDPDEAAAACEAGNVNIWNEETAEYIAVNLAPAGMADALVNAFCSNGTPQEVYNACIALADAYTGGEDTSAEEAALGVQVATGPFVKEWHMAVNIGGNVEDFTDTLAEDAADEACARETLRRRWNHRKERRFYLAPDTERIVDVYYNLI